MSLGPIQPAPPTSDGRYGPIIRVERAPGNGMAVAALVLGIVAIVSGVWIVIPFIGIVFAFLSFVPAVLAVVFGALGLRRARVVLLGRGFALTGLILGGATLAIAVLTTAVWVLAIAASGQSAIQAARQAPPLVASSAPAAEPTAAAPEPTQTVYSQGSIDATGVSRYSARYYARVTGAKVDGDSVIVAIDAHGDSLLRAPASSCVVDSAGDVAKADGSALSTSRPGRYIGDLRFPLTGLTGGLSFVYSCTSDYSAVQLLP